MTRSALYILAAVAGIALCVAAWLSSPPQPATAVRPMRPPPLRSSLRAKSPQGETLSPSSPPTPPTVRKSTAKPRRTEMRSSMRRGLTYSLILASTLPLAALSACAHRPSAILLASPCSTLVPTEWRRGVPAPDLPAGSTAGDWAAFADAAVGALDRSNARTVDALTIVERCEARDAASAQASRPRPWWRLGR